MYDIQYIFCTSFSVCDTCNSCKLIDCIVWLQVLQNVDDLFDREEFSAAPDVGWPDCFNSGVFVYRPSEETYRALLHLAITQGSFDGK